MEGTPGPAGNRRDGIEVAIVEAEEILGLMSGRRTTEE